MKNIFRTLIVTIAVLAVPALLRAQTGCEDSPEDPTLILALVASAGAAVSYARSRFSRK